MNCEMCGKKGTHFYVSEIEGVALTVCQECSVYGKILKRPQLQKPFSSTSHGRLQKQGSASGFSRSSFATLSSTKQEQDAEQSVVAGYGLLIKQAREKLGLKQEELAKAVNEKVSLIHQLESYRQVPSLALAKKLEKKLGICLLEHSEQGNNSLTDDFSKQETKQPLSQQHLTIGDIITLKKR
ncbi:MAG: multiprotein bridging factor aMBF1 [Candidatus Woesearchaeota archaeon]